MRWVARPTVAGLRSSKLPRHRRTHITQPTIAAAARNFAVDPMRRRSTNRIPI
jgi:hypothetical protein